MTYYSLSKELPYNSKYILRIIKELEDNKMIEREHRGRKKIILKTSFGEELLAAVNIKKKEIFEDFYKNDISLNELISFFSNMKKMNEDSCYK